MPHLLDKNEKMMKTVKKCFALFVHMMEEGHVYRNPGLDFRRVCRLLGVSPVDLDEMLMEETGCSGEEIFAIYRKIDKNH